MHSSYIYIKIPPHEIHFFKFIIEAYDGVALISTICAKKGHIVACVGRGMEGIFYEILSTIDLKTVWGEKDIFNE